MEIVFVAAMSENHVIGIGGQLPWHLPNDLKRFKQLTTGGHVLMGRKTFASIGRALPHRHNLVLTKDVRFFAPNVEVVHSKEELMRRDYARLYVIGGEEIYRLFFPDCQRVHLTIVHATLQGDAFFPHLDGFRTTFQEAHERDERHAYPYTFFDYERAGN